MIFLKFNDFLLLFFCLVNFKSHYVYNSHWIPDSKIKQYGSYVFKANGENHRPEIRFTDPTKEIILTRNNSSSRTKQTKVKNESNSDTKSIQKF